MTQPDLIFTNVCDILRWSLPMVPDEEEMEYDDRHDVAVAAATTYVSLAAEIFGEVGVVDLK